MALTIEEQRQLQDLQAKASDGKGAITIWMEGMFGRNWRTSVSTFLGVLSGASGMVLDTLKDAGLTSTMLKFIALAFVLIAGLSAKDKAVTGVNVLPSTGLAGPTEVQLITESAKANPADPTKQAVTLPPEPIK